MQPSQSCELPGKALIPCREPSASTSWLCLFLQPSSGQIDVEELGDEPKVWSDRGHPDTVMSSVLLEVLVGLSERAEMVSRVMLGQPGPGAECKAVAWPGLGVRMWGDCSKDPPYCCGAWGGCPERSPNTAFSENGNSLLHKGKKN